jgi:AcrR family transcriptional regulator
VQARSAASVKAILEATIQVLLSEGKERLTTTRVARRAGVSVGTLYQYFPNKSALLQAALKQHMDEVAGAVERVCREQKGNSLRQMATALITAFLGAKMKDAKTSVALYSVSSDVDGAKVSKQVGTRTTKAIVGMLKTARESLNTDPQLVADMLQGAMAGMSRRLLEAESPEKQVEPMRQELIFFVCAYLDARSSRPGSSECKHLEIRPAIRVKADRSEMDDPLGLLRIACWLRPRVAMVLVNEAPSKPIIRSVRIQPRHRKLHRPLPNYACSFSCILICIAPPKHVSGNVASTPLKANGGSQKWQVNLRSSRM